MRTVAASMAVGMMLVTPAMAQPQTPGWQQTLQGLMSGNQGQDQAVREAYERGYQRGRQDEARMRAERRGQNDRYGQYPPRPSDQQPDPQYYNR
jgi:hypothetical protein